MKSTNVRRYTNLVTTCNIPDREIQNPEAIRPIGKIRIGSNPNADGSEHVSSFQITIRFRNGCSGTRYGHAVPRCTFTESDESKTSLGNPGLLEPCMKMVLVGLRMVSEKSHGI
jgi:hypothetical protein